MDTVTIITGILIFSTTILAIEGFYYILETFKKRGTRRRLRIISQGGGSEGISIIRTTTLSDIPWLNRILLSVPRFKKIDDIIKQAGIELPLGFFILLSLLLGFLGFYGSWYIARDFVLGVLAAGFFGMSPTFYVLYKKKKRMQLFERQLPDALELLSRSLRAGHSFSAGVQMVAHELPDPIGTEFGKVFAEIRYGLSAPQTLKNLADRIDCEALRLFVLSVIIQRETGGNLAEMMDNISYIIRERFKLLGKVKALAAEGVYSAWILSLLPFFMAFILYVIRRDYVLMLLHDPWGKTASSLALAWLCLGIFIIRKIVKIKV